MIGRLASLAYAGVALGLIAYGVWEIHQPSAAIVLGGLLWIDLNRRPRPSQ